MNEPIITISELRKAIRNDPATSRILMPCTKAEIYLDLNGDGIADFAFADSDNSGAGDTFAVDLTGNGEFNLYLKDTDMNGIADDIRYYPDGSDTPSYVNTNKTMETTLVNSSGKLAAALSGDFNGAAFLATLKELKESVLNDVGKILRDGKIQPYLTIDDLRRRIRNDAVTGKMMLPSMKNEVFLDVDGDGKADFALISSASTGNVDTFAVDMTGNGEFNLYFKDTDMNGIGDDIRYYQDGEEDPVFISTDKKIELVINDNALKLIQALSGEFDGAAFVQVLKELKATLIFDTIQTERTDVFSSEPTNGWKSSLTTAL